MHVPSLQPISSDHFCSSGDVTIHPTAVIASGVLLQADPESRIVIGAGVCLGMGTVLHAHQGTLEVEAEVTIGAGVLIIGAVTIGTSACIGAASTVWNYSVARGVVIPPLSLLGVSEPGSDRTSADQPPIAQLDQIANSGSSAQESKTPEPEVPEPEVPEPEVPEPEVPEPNAQASLNGAVEAALSQPAAEIQLSFSAPVYGQENLNRLLSTLLPHRQAFLKGQE